jgi:hypothetical protein
MKRHFCLWRGLVMRNSGQFDSPSPLWLLYPIIELHRPPPATGCKSLVLPPRLHHSWKLIHEEALARVNHPPTNAPPPWMDGWMVYGQEPLVFIQFLFWANLPHSCEFYGCVWDGIKMDEREKWGWFGARWVTPALRFLNITFEGVTLEITGWLIVEPTHLTPPPIQLNLRK